MSNEIMSTDSRVPTAAPVPFATPSAAAYDRRGLLRIGGLTATTAVLVAACGTSEAGTLGRIGEGGTTPVLADPIVDNGVLLRTMAGIETSIANAYQRILDGGFLAKPGSTFPEIGDLSELVALFQTHHAQAAESFNALATEAGAESWACGNARLDSAYITPIFDRVEKGVTATDSALAIGPSDDPARDYANLVHALETLSAESCQALVPVVTEPAFRFTAMQLGVRSARQATLMALRNYPGGYIAGAADAATADTTAATSTTAAPAGAAPANTPIPLPYAIPAQFGLLSPVVYIGGAGDENGVRLKLNLETPSLNSFAYPFDTCA